jgi:hypothetical protein
LLSSINTTIIIGYTYECQNAFESVLVLLYACGGGGGGDDVSNTDDDGGQPASDMNNISGRLFLGGEGDGFVLNLKTGLLSIIPNVDWNYTSNDNDGYESMVSYSATSNYHGTEFLLTVDHCAESSDPSFSLFRDDCIEIRDSITGTRKRRGRLTPDIKSGAKFSRDGNYLAFFHYDQRLSQPDDTIIIADREFNIA